MKNTAGANLVLLLKTVTTKGRGAGLLNVSGFVLAAFIHGSLAILGLSQVIVKSTELFFLVKMVGSIYLAYLGVKMIYQSFIGRDTKALTAEVYQNSQHSLKSFGEGFLTQMLNPKGTLFYISIFPQFIDFNSFVYTDAFILISIHAALMMTWFGSICFMISKIKNLGQGAISCWVQRGCGSALLIFSALLLRQTD
ncbi:LysE family translocator [Vibrio breoganii]|uniref:LysE family translocator n=1 Tax=Vibrio breoganii TaxID=553239 RepID=UPI0012FFECE9|nr:LysE family translocator [Vibrio breoganii]